MQLYKADTASHADAADTNLGDVLGNGLVFAQIWGHLDAVDKRELWAVGRGVRELADDLVVALLMHNKSASELHSALARWPDVERLTADCAVHSVPVISALPLCKLKALSLRHLVRTFVAFVAHVLLFLASVPCICSIHLGLAHTLQHDERTSRENADT